MSSGSIAPPNPDDVCAQEPIQVPGSVQPHGLLLGLDVDNRIVVASANVATLLGLPVDAVLGMPAGDVIGEVQLTTALASVSPGDLDGVGGPLRLRLPAVAIDGAQVPATVGTLAGAEVDVLVHRSTGLQIVEIEPVADALGAGAMSYRTARAALARMTAARNVADLCDLLAAEVATLTGFDRVMVYRFDGDWNGEVVAERCAPGLEPYLGLRYPASDIPAQARALYVRNWTRLISDAAYVPSPLVPDRNPATGERIDLSRAALRSVSPIHLRYLANMGVRSSMSLSLVIGDRLWGLVACHHGEPHRPSLDARTASEFLAQVASSTIGEQQAADLDEVARRSATEVAALIERVGHVDAEPEVSLAEAAPEVLRLLSADALAIRTDRLTLVGDGLTAPTAEAVADALARADVGAPVTTTESLRALDPRLAAQAGGFAGAARVDLGNGRWLLVLRPELTRTVTWGGDPTAKVVETRTADGSPGYGPRESFARWQEEVRGRSVSWHPHESDALLALREFVERTRLRRAREQLFVAESLQRALVMPVAPTVPGVELATRYAPSQSGILGGDWWDVVPVSGARYALVVGDVSGHGVDAAATMAQIRTSLRTYLLDGTPPGEALDRLDRAVAALMRRTIVTCWIGVIDPVSSTVDSVGAAHLAPLVLRPDADGGASVSPVQGAGRPPLGVRVEAGATPVRVELEPGDVLLAFSDGLVERRDVGLDETLERLSAQLAGNPPLPGRLDQWLGELVERPVGDGTDDTTVLAARIRA